MASSKEIRNKITSIKKTQKITDAMQKVAASKMRRAQRRMETSEPYANKIREIMAHVASSKTESHHPYALPRPEVKSAGYIVVSTDRGLCGSLNINLFKMVMEHAKNLEEQGIKTQWYLIGGKAEQFFRQLKASVLAHSSGFGDEPQVTDIVGGLKVMLDEYSAKRIDRLYIVHNEFISTMVQKPRILQLLPLEVTESAASMTKANWDYIYEPDPKLLLPTLLVRYVETQVYQAIVDNLACEEVARMLAMKNATDSAEEIINKLGLIYNKARQAAITQEITEIIGGAEAV